MTTKIYTYVTDAMLDAAANAIEDAAAAASEDSIGSQIGCPGANDGDRDPGDGS
jgi:hypothetical protein